jgi:hypothetical protein
VCAAASSLLLLVAAAGCGSGRRAQPEPQQEPNATAAGPRQLTDLRDIGQLRSLFNTRSGEPRLILLVSPT